MRTIGPHFFTTADAVDGDRIHLAGDQAHHLSRVLRARAGDPVSIGDGAGSWWQTRVAAVGDRVALAVTDSGMVPRARPAVTVVHALPKGRKLDDVVQRLTEIGVERIVPVHSARSQVRLEGPRADKAVSRWRAVALAAAKQSRRLWLPEVAEVGDWASAFAHQRGVVFWEAAQEGIANVAGGLAEAEELLIGVGPEGGLASDEVAATGLPAASLGPTILRTETAALVGVVAVLTLCGRIG